MITGIKRALALALALTIASVPSLALAEDIVTHFGKSVADDQDVALLIKYHGTAAAAYVTVSAAGDLTFEITDTSTVDTSLECDASIAADGSRNGIYDVSVAACDTLGEVCDLINTQAEEWACVILDGLRTDTPGPSGTGFILAASDQPAKVLGGYSVKWDTSAALTTTIAVVPPALRKIESYYSTSSATNKTFNTNMFKGQTTLLSHRITNTYGSGTSLYRVYDVELTPSRTLGASAETVSTYLGPWTAASSTAEGAYMSSFLPFGLPTPKDRKIITRLTNSAAMGTVTNSLVASLARDPGSDDARRGR